jgi:hypothetical protein
MKSNQMNRRINRSEDIQVALSFQLAATAKKAKFGSIVLADDLGLVVAAAGRKSTCEQMAAVSPMLVAKEGGPCTIKNTKGSILLSVEPVHMGCMQLYLCASEGEESAATHELHVGVQGITRILA